MCSNSNENKVNQPVSSNPCAVEDSALEDALRGDAIGNTLYSECFVLKTLLKLNSQEEINLEQDEEFENDLCTLWDMSIERDVVMLLLSHDVLDTFTSTIKFSKDDRLTEIMIGLLGNMCSFTETRKKLYCNMDFIIVVLQEAGCADAPTLIQLMRFIIVLFTIRKEETALYRHKEIFESFTQSTNFVDHLVGILSNSLNKTLLHCTLDALKVIIFQFDSAVEMSYGGDTLTYMEFFINANLIQATIEAFQTLKPSNPNESVLADPEVLQAVDNFMIIHALLMQHRSAPSNYINNIPDLFTQMEYVLELLCDPECFHKLCDCQMVVRLIAMICMSFDSLPVKIRLNCYITLLHNIAKEKQAKDTDSDFDDKKNSSIELYDDFIFIISSLIEKTDEQHIEIEITDSNVEDYEHICLVLKSNNHQKLLNFLNKIQENIQRVKIN